MAQRNFREIDLELILRYGSVIPGGGLFLSDGDARQLIEEIERARGKAVFYGEHGRDIVTAYRSTRGNRRRRRIGRQTAAARQ